MKRRKARCRPSSKRRAVRDAKAILRKAERDRKADEARSDQTRQRKFERSFESRDLADSRAARADASDGGKFVSLSVGAIDAEIRQRLRTAKINRAAATLPRPVRKGQLPMCTLLWAIFRNVSDRAKTLVELHIRERTYTRGVKFLLEFFHVPRKSGVRRT